MAIYSVRYNHQCKATNFDKACFTILEAASPEQAQELLVGPRPEDQECLGRKCVNDTGHYPRMTVLSVRKLENFCLHGNFEQRTENDFYRFELELQPDAEEEIRFFQFPEVDLAEQDALRLPDSEQTFNPSRPCQYVKEVARGVKRELARTKNLQ